MVLYTAGQVAILAIPVWLAFGYILITVLYCFSVVMFIQGKSGVAGTDQTESTDTVEVTQTAEAAS